MYFWHIYYLGIPISHNGGPLRNIFWFLHCQRIGMIIRHEPKPFAKYYVLLYLLNVLDPNKKDRSFCWWTDLDSEISSFQPSPNSLTPSFHEYGWELGSLGHVCPKPSPVQIACWQAPILGAPELLGSSSRTYLLASSFTRIRRFFFVGEIYRISNYAPLVWNYKFQNEHKNFKSWI